MEDRNAGDHAKENTAGRSKRPFEVYDYDGIIQTLINRIEGRLSEKNASCIKQYDMEMVGQSLGKATRRKHLQTLLNLSIMLGKDWPDATKQDINHTIYKVMNRYSASGQETNTTYDYKKILKLFFRWLRLGSRDYREVGDPDETRSIRLKNVKDTLLREDLLTTQDKESLLKAVSHSPRDRAFIDCHFEAGTRPSEILNMQLKHVRFDSVGAVLRVDGKTGTRSIRLVKSVPNLAAWISSHPFSDNPEAPLWIILNRTGYGQQLTYYGARMLLHRACKKAGLSKPVNLKLFRHSEATSTAQYLTESQMRKRHGWSGTSRMPARYVHMTNKDVEDAYLQHLGIKPQNEDRDVPITCAVCKMANPYNSERCVQCGKFLNVQSAEQWDEKNKQNIDDSIERFKEQNRKETGSIIDSLTAQIDEVRDQLKKSEQKRSDDLRMFGPFISTSDDVADRLYLSLKNAKTDDEVKKAAEPIIMLGVVRAIQSQVSQMPVSKKRARPEKNESLNR